MNNHLEKEYNKRSGGLDRSNYLPVVFNNLGEDIKGFLFSFPVGIELTNTSKGTKVIISFVSKVMPYLHFILWQRFGTVKTFLFQVNHPLSCKSAIRLLVQPILLLSHGILSPIVYAQSKLIEAKSRFEENLKNLSSQLDAWNCKTFISDYISLGGLKYYG